MNLQESIHIALCALSSETRAKIVAELDRAGTDTAMEYHRTYQPETMRMLAGEVEAILFVSQMVESAQSEYDELSESIHSSREDGPSEQGIPASSPRGDAP